MLLFSCLSSSIVILIVRPSSVPFLHPFPIPLCLPYPQGRELTVGTATLPPLREMQCDLESRVDVPLSTGGTVALAVTLDTEDYAT